MQHPLYANCPPLSIPMHIFDCLLKILNEEYEESKLDNWHNKFVNEDSNNIVNSIHGVLYGSVDDTYTQEENIDYQEVSKEIYFSVINFYSFYFHSCIKIYHK